MEEQKEQHLVEIHKNMEIRQTKNMGLGYFAKEEIVAQTVLIKAEEEDFLTYNSIIFHDYYGDILEDTDDKKLAMAYYLASIEKICVQSEFCDLLAKKYIEIIPKSFDCLVCWSQDELDYLQDEKLKLEILRLQQSIKNGIKQIQQRVSYCPILKPNPLWLYHIEQKIDKKQITYLESQATKPNSLDQDQSSENSWECSESDNEVYQTMERTNRRFGNEENEQVLYQLLAPKIELNKIFTYYAAVCSRNFYFSTHHDQSSAIGALVPYMDHINHKKESCCQFQKKGNSLIVYATRNIEKDEQIFLKYGDFNLQETLKIYGFVGTDIIPSETGRKGIAEQYKKMKEYYKNLEK